MKFVNALEHLPVLFLLSCHFRINVSNFMRSNAHCLLFHTNTRQFLRCSRLFCLLLKLFALISFVECCGHVSLIWRGSTVYFQGKLNVSCLVTNHTLHRSELSWQYGLLWLLFTLNNSISYSNDGILNVPLKRKPLFRQFNNSSISDNKTSVYNVPLNFSQSHDGIPYYCHTTSQPLSCSFSLYCRETQTLISSTVVL